MKFRYKNYGQGTLRPVIPIEVGYNGIAVPYEVLVDSGADFCIFDAQIGEILGVYIEKGEKFNVAGITGKLEPYYVHPVTIKVGGWDYKIKAGFMPNMGRFSHGIVGQKGFFDIFIIQFDLLKSEIELKPRWSKN